MNSERPLVSIMIPTYNQPDFLPEAVDSPLAQTYPNLEIIIADDRSTDEACREALAAYANTPRVRVCRNETNLGRVANYQKTLYEREQGEWVLNLDGDDYFVDPTFIEQAVRLAQAHPGVVMVSRMFVDRSPEDRLKPSEANSGQVRGYSAPEAFEAMLRLMLTGHAASIPREAMVRRRHSGNVSSAISVPDFPDNTITFSAPLRAGSAVETKVDKVFVRECVALYTFRKGKDNAYKILEYNQSNAGYFAYVREIARCAPKNGSSSQSVLLTK